MTFMVADEFKLEVNQLHSVKIALTHDLVEAIAGDIDAIRIAKGEVTKEEKQKAEKEAMKELKDALPGKLGREIHDLWEEYENCSTKEAKFIKALDKLETTTQLVESGYKTYDNPEFIANYANKSVKDFPELTDMLLVIKRKLKEEFNKGNIKWKEEYDSLRQELYRW